MARRANEFLTLYRRHLASCEVPKKKVSVARKRTADCGCPIWIYGRTPHGTFYPRQTTGETDWQAAEEVRSRLMAGQSVGTQTAEVGITIADAIAKYVRSREHELSEKTIGHHRLSLGRLEEFARSRGAKRMADLTVDLLEDFKTAGLPAAMAGTTKSKAVEKVRCFLKEAYRRGWLDRPIVEKLKPYRARYEQKEPYTDDDVNKMLAEALKLNGGTHGYAKHPQTFRLLLELMLDTGMRVGDAIRYDPAATSKDGEVWVYTYTPQKAKRSERIKTIEAFIPDRLKKAIDECDWLSPKLPFFYGDATNPAYLANEVYERMKTLGARCGVKDCRPHRLRDTFAVRMLLAGLSIEDVSRLLGHSSVKVTEMYYAKWIAARKRRLASLASQALMNTDRYRLGDGNGKVPPAANR